MTHNNTIEQIDNLVKHYRDCAADFAEDPFKFIDEMNNCLQKKQTQKDLAKKLNYPQHLVKYIVSTLKEIYDHRHDYHDYTIKKYIQEKTKGEFLVNTDDLLNSFSDNDKEEGLIKIEVYVEDSPHWQWDTEYIATPFYIDGINKILNFVLVENFYAYSNAGGPGDWCLELNLKRRNNVEISSQKEKQEVLEMLILMEKYLR